jgi:hypothetical protein
MPRYQFSDRNRLMAVRVDSPTADDAKDFVRAHSLDWVRRLRYRRRLKPDEDGQGPMLRR